MQTWMLRWCHPLVEQSARTAALKCWVRSKVVAGSSEIGLWFISEEHPKKCLLFRRQSRDEGWSVGRMNSGINFSLRSQVLCVWAGRMRLHLLPFLHICLNLEQLALAGWATLTSPCCSWGSLQQRAASAFPPCTSAPVSCVRRAEQQAQGYFLSWFAETMTYYLEFYKQALLNATDISLNLIASHCSNYVMSKGKSWCSSSCVFIVDGPLKIRA